MASSTERHHRVPRRGFIFWGTALLASATPLGQMFWRMGGTEGIRDSMSYLTEAEQKRPLDRIKLFLGNHRLPEPYGDANTAVWDPYINYGDISASLWRRPERTMIAERMREVHAAGKPYIIVVDGQTPQQQVATKDISVLSMPMIPLPPNLNSNKPEDMPDSFYVVSAEPLDRFGLQSQLLFPDEAKIGKEVEAIGDEIYSRYDPYTNTNNKREYVAESTQVETDIKIFGLEVATLAAGTISQIGNNIATKDRILGAAAAGTVAVIDAASLSHAIDGDNGTLAYDIGYDLSQQAQRKDTIIADTTGENSHTPLDLWTLARTALGVEKAEGILEHPTIYAKPPTQIGTPSVPAQSVDLLYGTFHNVAAPRIMEDKSFRKQTVQAFLYDLLHTAKSAIEARRRSSDPDIAKRFSDPKMMFYLLNSVKSSLGSGKITKVTIPWGQSRIEPKEGSAELDIQDVVRFENTHAEITQYIYSLEVSAWADEVLEAFLIDQHIPYDKGYFHPGETPSPQSTPTLSRRGLLRKLIPQL